MARDKKTEGVETGGFMGLGGLLGGLNGLMEKLGELAEKGGEIRDAGEIGGLDPKGKLRGVYGFTIKTAVGGDGIKVEPFGNVQKDEETGGPVVREMREPMVDVFEEDDHVLVVAEMPGVGEEDVQLACDGDILTITAERGDMKYRKEVLLPSSFSTDKISHVCRNGVVEVRLTR